MFLPCDQRIKLFARALSSWQELCLSLRSWKRNLVIPLQIANLQCKKVYKTY
ncbi:hypothetical protein AHAS_Ahas14G0136600 [Arachis hypogaea]